MSQINVYSTNPFLCVHYYGYIQILANCKKKILWLKFETSYILNENQSIENPNKGKKVIPRQSP